MYVGKPQEHFFIKRKFNVFYLNMDASVLSILAVAWQTMCDENTQKPNWSLCNIDCCSYYLIVLISFLKTPST